MSSFMPTCSYKLIYIFRINDDAHAGMVKIGEASLRTTKSIDELPPNCHDLNQAAKDRIASYTATAAIPYELLHTELAVRMVHNYAAPFRDHDVHSVLLASGIVKHHFDTGRKANEWFVSDFGTARRAISAVKEGRMCLDAHEKSTQENPIVFRPEQKEAIEKTVKQFKKHNRMLWNAKMRFGKTLCALEVVKRMGYQRTIIFTHRPVVKHGWFEDFDKIFTHHSPHYRVGSKDERLNLDNLSLSSTHFVYFASIQDLRGSAAVGGRFEKNDLVFSIPWDCVIIDEAHEGTKTELGENVISSVVKENTRVLYLSGTPFNLRDDFSESEIYTWDYVMEQSAKLNWEKEHPGDPNPYAVLPRLNIFTYDLDELIPGFQSLEDAAFNFREFFRTWRGDKALDGRPMPAGAKVDGFVHERAVLRFLDMMCDETAPTNYPYSTQEYRDNFRHSLWMLPGVKEARALSALMQTHPVFGSGAFNIVNVAGDGDEEKFDKDAYQAVRKAISDKPDETYSITLSCGRLTTGVSIKEWTAVFMLSGSATTAASGYLQTIFRVQTPGCIGARQKTEYYVFDFAPDRTLQMVAEAARVSSGAGQTTERDREIMAEFLNFCPVISLTGSRMEPYDVRQMLQQLKKAYIERVVRSGFDDNRLYNDKLMLLDGMQLQDFEKLRKIVGTTKQAQKVEKIDINTKGFTQAEYDNAKGDERRPKKELTHEQLKRLELLKEIRKNKEKAISILRGISIRIPLLIYGAELKEDEHITLQNLTFKVDDVSWAEFMPRGVDKALFRKFVQYYDPEIFEGAGVRIRELTKAADSLSVVDRIKRIAEIFKHFRNPDKETVLTPWRVVNMQLSDCLGGYDFFDENHRDVLDTPRSENYGKVTADTLSNPDARILEMNAKTGLYSLYVAYSIFRTRIARYRHVDPDLEKQIWQQVLSENIFIICKTRMSRSIACRTLAGFTGAHVNVHSFDDFINQITSKVPQFIKRASRPSTYGCNNLPNTLMRFNAIVGNPPYQVQDGGDAADDASKPIYDDFMRIAKEFNPNYISLLMPSRWMVGGRAKLLSFRKEMMEDLRLKKFVDFEDAGECFPGQHIDGGICYCLWAADYEGDVQYTYKPREGVAYTVLRNLRDGGQSIVIRDARRVSLISKMSVGTRMSSIVSKTKPYGIRKDLFNKPERHAAAEISEESRENYVGIWGVKGIKGGARRRLGYIRRDYVKKNVGSIDKYKLFFTTSFSAGAIEPPEIIAADPGVICTETFLEIGPFDTQEERDNCLEFMTSKVFKVLLYFSKGTMQVNQEVFDLVPLLDFKRHWSEQDVYEHFKLSRRDIHEIESYFV